MLCVTITGIPIALINNDHVCLIRVYLYSEQILKTFKDYNKTLRDYISLLLQFVLDDLTIYY